MFIVWGSRGEKNILGVVADDCARCHRAEKFVAQEYVRTEHVYGISTGSTRLAITRQCTVCDAEYECELERYDEIISPAEAELMPFKELLEETNTPLSKLLRDSQTHVPSDEPQAAALPDIESEKQWARLSELLAPYQQEPEGEKLARKWHRSPDMSEYRRKRLLARIDRFLREKETAKEILALFERLGDTKPGETFGCLAAMGMVAVTISAYWWLPTD
ncbi:hypothetical protein [Zavarzinella formosa]|uniref:hypothetical protein n=1 Tax=Zavarzinella formosa TaxID=360055 RepID=UPI0002FD7C80|nr:hypothetical protein [Zavarzinella formosa]